MFYFTFIRVVGIALVFSIAACADDVTPERPDAAAGESDGATNSEAGRETSDGSARSGDRAMQCTVPRDCESVDLGVSRLDACCTESIACGFGIDGTQDERDAVTDGLKLPRGSRCIGHDRFFVTYPGSEEKRVVDEQGQQYLLTYECESSALISLSFIGCCMPNGRCGVSTYGLYDMLAVLAPEGYPFTKPQCVSSTELNAQLKNSKFSGLAKLPNTDKPCDYAALDAKLTESEPF